eukprot:GHVU01196835.1.p1 GENE.GHVU01196835.1~~GHVU01196835.1.p1  ORF type:complete len:153 (+),score=4.95 GHVU01196835.1:223-681(+)
MGPCVNQKCIVSCIWAGIGFTLGIACLIISVQDRDANPIPDCGMWGSPPLREYLLGSGCAYLILAVAYVIIAAVGDKVAWFGMIIGILANIFLFSWMVVGSVSLWRDGTNCQEINYPVWATGMATVITTIILVVFGFLASCSCGKKQEEAAS